MKIRVLAILLILISTMCLLSACSNNETSDITPVAKTTSTTTTHTEVTTFLQTTENTSAIDEEPTLTNPEPNNTEIIMEELAEEFVLATYYSDIEKITELSAVDFKNYMLDEIKNSCHEKNCTIEEYFNDYVEIYSEQADIPYRNVDDFDSFLDYCKELGKIIVEYNFENEVTLTASAKSTRKLSESESTKQAFTPDDSEERPWMQYVDYDKIREYYLVEVETIVNGEPISETNHKVAIVNYSGQWKVLNYYDCGFLNINNIFYLT